MEYQDLYAKRTGKGDREGGVGIKKPKIPFWRKTKKTAAEKILPTSQ